MPALHRSTAMPTGFTPEVVIVDHDNKVVERSRGTTATPSDLAREIGSLVNDECDCGMACGAHGYKEVLR